MLLILVIPWKVFFPFLVTEVEITGSFFSLRRTLPQSLMPDAILSAVTSCFLWKTGSPDSSARNRVSSSEEIKYAFADYTYIV